MEVFTVAGLLALFQIIVIDVLLAGDNAIVIGMAAAGVAAAQRSKVIFWGMAAAVGLRIIFTGMAGFLLTIPGLTFVGGILLAWVCWKFWCEIRSEEHDTGAEGALAPVSVWAAVWTIVMADLSMSIDNVLAVAGASDGHYGIMVFGLLLSVALMAFAANGVAKLLERFPKLAYAGLAVIVYVSGDMLYKGWAEVDSFFGVNTYVASLI